MRRFNSSHPLRLALACSTAIALSATPARAQLVTLFDVIDALTQLDTTVTLQGQIITGLQSTVSQQTVAILQAQADVSLLQSTTASLGVQVNANAALDGQQGTDILGVQAGLTANAALDAQQGADILAVQADLSANAALDAQQGADILGVQAGLTANAALDAQQGADIAGVQAGLTANAALDATQSGLIGQLGVDLAANTAGDLVQDGAIAVLDVRLTANDVVDAQQGTDITGLQAGLAANTAGDAVQSGQIGQLQIGLAANTAGDLVQDGAIAALGTRVTANEALDVQQGTEIAGLQAGLAANVVRDDAQDGSLAGLQTGLAANTANDVAQDLRLDYHDVLLADHDARITLAQGSADNALAAVGLLRADVDTGRAGVIRVDTSGNLAVGGGLGGTSVSFAGTSGDRRLTGIANGVAANDAATVGQMTAADAAVLAAATSYTDTSLASLTGDIDSLFTALSAQNKDLRSELDAAAAGAAALAGMPQAFVPGQGMVSMGVGGRGGEMAVAIGFGKAFTAPHTPVIRAGAAIDSKRGQVTYNAGVGFHF